MDWRFGAAGCALRTVKQFIARYAFIAVPVGNTLDLNYVYNDATQPDSTMALGTMVFSAIKGLARGKSTWRHSSRI